MSALERREDGLPVGTVAVVCVLENAPGMIQLVPLALDGNPDLTQPGPYVGQWLMDNSEAVVLMAAAGYRAHMEAVRARALAEATAAQADAKTPKLQLVAPDGSKMQ